MEPRLHIISLPARACFSVSAHCWRVERDADADRFMFLLPHLVELAVELLGLRRHLEHERLAVGPVAPAVAVAIDVAEEIEQRLRRAGFALISLLRPGRSRRCAARSSTARQRLPAAHLHAYLAAMS